MSDPLDDEPGASEAEGPPVLPFQTEPPSPDHLTRGLSAARAIEHTAGLVRKSRSHAGKRPPRKHEWTHRRARRQLKKLRKALEGLQRRVLSDGLSAPRLEALQAQLSHLDAHLEALLAQPVDRTTLSAVRKLARGARRQLREL